MRVCDNEKLVDSGDLSRGDHVEARCTCTFISDFGMAFEQSVFRIGDDIKCKIIVCAWGKKAKDFPSAILRLCLTTGCGFWLEVLIITFEKSCLPVAYR